MYVCVYMSIHIYVTTIYEIEDMNLKGAGTQQGLKE